MASFKFPGFSNGAEPLEKISNTPVVVIGLGRFGTALADELMNYGVEVLGLDSNERIVREHATDYTDCAVVDSTDPEALRQLGVDESQRVVVAIGGSLEGSILTASNLVEMGIPDIWAKANSEKHGRILEQLGVHHVIRPESDTGRRIAHLLGGRFIDYADLDRDYGMIKMTPPESMRSGEWDPDKLWKKYKVDVVAVKSPSVGWHPYRAYTALNVSDLIVVAGDPARLEAFAQVRRVDC